MSTKAVISIPCLALLTLGINTTFYLCEWREDHTGAPGSEPLKSLPAKANFKHQHEHRE